jgi:lysozyme
VRRAGIRFAWIKATEGGDRVDDAFAANWEGARAAGLARGAYHFFYFCRPVEDQIAWFEAHVPVEADALPPVLDIEWTPTSPTCRRRPPRAEVLAAMRIFLREVERHYGKRPIIYTTVDFHRDVLDGEPLAYPLWVRSTAGHPRHPYGSRRWHIWQYTATGTVPGIDGHVDRNAYSGSLAEWQRFVTGSGS